MPSYHKESLSRAPTERGRKGGKKSTTSRNIQDVSSKLEKCSSKPEAPKVDARVRPSSALVTSSRCILSFSFETKELPSVGAKRLQGEREQHSTIFDAEGTRTRLPD